MKPPKKKFTLPIMFVILREQSLSFIVVMHLYFMTNMFMIFAS